MTNQKSLGEFGEKKNKRVKDRERLAPPKVKKMPPRLMFPRPTLAKPEKSRKKPKKKSQRENIRTVLIRGMLLRSHAITTTRKAIIPSTTPSQKTSGSRDGFQKPCNAFFVFNTMSSPG